MAVERKRTLARWAESFWSIEPWTYAVWAAALTLVSARTFFRAMMTETHGEWSAPLDDVFIHFDYARAITEHHPFEWVAGNGYSSGNTSLLYPFVLALGYAGGFRDGSLMLWSGMVAAASVWGLLLAGRKLFLRTARSRIPSTRANDTLARMGSYLLPIFVLGLGALDWSLWSGMEVAFFLATWACALLAYFALVDADGPSSRGYALLLGGAGAVMVVTRPEAVTSIALFGLTAAYRLRRTTSLKNAVICLIAAGAPGALLLVIQTAANRIMTGEFSANGAIVKLAIYNPFLTPGEKFADYASNFHYAIFRNIEHHFADHPAFGYLIPFFAIFALGVRRTRSAALLLWGQATFWLALVALNGQIRWQNERYTMPAVAWFLMAAALGAWELATGTIGSTVATRPWVTRARIAATVLLFGVIAVRQAPNMADQIGFFGRASRNIRDQHLTAGRFLAGLNPRRVLVGDAGALMYASHAPGLDIIGLGGYHDYPFARAGVQGLAATIELIERMPVAERPDVMAIYPGWWGVLPLWFSGGVIARFPIVGNVICGGEEKVIYATDWHALGAGGDPRSCPAGEEVRDVIDVADLVSEAEHTYAFSKPGGGWTDMKILADPREPGRDLFDGGRRIPGGRLERFTARNLRPDRPAHLIVRSAPDAIATVGVHVDGIQVGTFETVPIDGWTETVVALPASTVHKTVSIELRNAGPGDFVDYHAWITQAPP